MVLSDAGIKTALDDGTIGIEPRPPDSRIDTSSVDLTLSNIFRIWKPENFTARGAEVILNLEQLDYLSVANGYLCEAPTDKDGCLVIPPWHKHPWHFLAQTQEKITLSHKVAARVEGRSSLARVGLIVHLTAPTIQSGFDASITLEMINFGPFHLKLVPRTTKICQIIFERLDPPAVGQIKTSFQGQKEPGGGHQR